MELKVGKISNGFAVLLPKRLLEELALKEGSMVEVEKVDGTYRLLLVDAEFSRQVEASLRTEPLHKNAYRELAK